MAQSRALTKPGHLPRTEKWEKTENLPLALRMWLWLPSTLSLSSGCEVEQVSKDQERPESITVWANAQSPSIAVEEGRGHYEKRHYYWVPLTVTMWFDSASLSLRILRKPWELVYFHTWARGKTWLTSWRQSLFLQKSECKHCENMGPFGLSATVELCRETGYWAKEDSNSSDSTLKCRWSHLHTDRWCCLHTDSRWCHYQRLCKPSPQHGPAVT